MTNSAFTPTVVQTGIGVVQPGVADGLVSLNGVPGSTDGLGVAVSYVGHTKTSYSSLAAATTGVWYTLNSHVIPAGNWLVLGSFTTQASGATGSSAQFQSRITYNAGADALLGKSLFAGTGNIATDSQFNFSFCYNLNFTGADRTYSQQFWWSGGAGNPLGLGHLTFIRLP